MKIYFLVSVIVCAQSSVKCMEDFSRLYLEENGELPYESSFPSMNYGLSSESNLEEINNRIAEFQNSPQTDIIYERALQSAPQSNSVFESHMQSLPQRNAVLLSDMQNAPEINSVYERTWDNPQWRNYLRKFSRAPPVIRYRPRSPIPKHSVIDPYSNSGQFPVDSRPPLNRDPMYAIPAPPTGFRQANPSGQHSVQPQYSSVQTIFKSSPQKYRS